MSLYNAINSRLTTAQTDDDATATDALAALAGLVGDRVHAVHSDGDGNPFVTVRISREADDAIDKRDTREFAVTLTAFAPTPQQAREIAGYIFTLLDRKTGEWASITCRCFFEGAEEDVFVGVGNVDETYFTQEETYIVHANCEF